MMSGHIVDDLAGGFGAVGAIDLVSGDVEAGLAVGDSDAAARGEERGSTDLAVVLLAAEFVDEVAVEAERDDSGDAVAFELVEGCGDVFGGVGGR